VDAAGQAEVESAEMRESGIYWGEKGVQGKGLQGKGLQGKGYKGYKGEKGRESI